MRIALPAVLLLAACAVPPSKVGSPADKSAIETAANYARIEHEVLVELNRARTDPHAYASVVSALVPSYDGTLLRRASWPVPQRTLEGAAAAREAGRVLGVQPAVAALTMSDGLSAAARELARDQAVSGGTGHTGSDGSTTRQRLERHGSWQQTYAENVAYGSYTLGQDVIVDLIIDDGVPDRGHRANIYNGAMRVAGVACGPHPKYGAMCVIVEAGGFVTR